MFIYLKFYQLINIRSFPKTSIFAEPNLPHVLVAGLYKVPCNLIFFPTPHYFKSWFPSQKLSSPHDLPNRLNIIENMLLVIDLPFPFLHVIFFHTAMIFPSQLHSLIFFPNRLNKELYGTLPCGRRSWSTPPCSSSPSTPTVWTLRDRPSLKWPDKSTPSYDMLDY